MNIYISRNGQQLGPFNESDIRDKYYSGQLLPNDFGWYEGMANWQPLPQIISSLPQPTASAPPHFALATLSFIFAVAAFAIWIFLDVLFINTHGFRNIREFDGVLIFLVLLCIVTNITGLTFGIIGTAKHISNKWMAIVGMIVNTLGFFGLLVIAMD